MQIRRKGRQPHESFAMVPNETARDSRLSFRSRGILAYLLSQQPGWRITTELVAREGSEGVSAVRTAFTQLEEAGYIRRVRVNDARGRIVRWCDLYPYGDAPADGEDADTEAIPEVEEEPAPENQSSVDHALVSPTHGNPVQVDPVQVEAVPYRTPSTEDSSTSPSAAAGSHPVGEVTSGSDDEPVPSSGQPFPTVEQRKLAAWFGVGAHEGVAWVAAWDTAQSFVTSAVEYDPQAHLAIYLSRCREERRKPRSDLWLRFFIEDRAKHVIALREEQEQLDHHHETPQEREDRINRRLPPVWADAPAAATETGADA